MVFHAKMRLNGFNISIWKFTCTVGCCENSMAKRMSPGNPVRMSRKASGTQKFFFLFHSKTLSAMMMTASVMNTRVGVMASA